MRDELSAANGRQHDGGLPHESRARRAALVLRRAVPTGRTLPDVVWARRHRALLVLLWVHVPALIWFAAAMGRSVGHAAIDASLVAALALPATLVAPRRLRSGLVAAGLLTCSAVAVHLSGGHIEAHFHFFVMVSLLALYEDWLPFLLAVGYVVGHHGVLGVMHAQNVYNHPAAQTHPWKWAAIHGGFVAAAAIGNIVSWRMNESVRAELRDAHGELAEAQAIARLGSWRVDLVTGVTTWSDEFFHLHGYEPGAFEPSTERFIEAVGPDEREYVATNITRLHAGESVSFEYRPAFDQTRTLHSTGDIVRGPDGSPVGRVGTCQDVTERRRAERELYEAKERFHKSFDEAPIGMALAAIGGNERGRLVQVNRSLCGLIGYTEDELLGRDIESLTHPDDRGNDRSKVESLIAGRATSYDVEKRYLRRDGHVASAQVNVTLVRDSNGLPHYLIVQVQDITARKVAEERLRHQALHDSLTGLPNRTLFLDRLQVALARARRHPTDLAVVFLDLDNFKLINDTLGHAVGDELLVAVGDRLDETVREDDTVARLGGDEFAIVCESLADDSTAVRAIVERLEKTFSRPFTMRGRDLAVTASMGIACAAADSTSGSLLRDADVAMYRAKGSGRARARVFDDSMHSKSDRLDFEHDLRRALERSEFHLVYQPVVHVDTRAVLAVEALLRWRHPVRGMISPAEFIPVAEQTGMISPIGAWVLQAACAEAAGWTTLSRGCAPGVSVNLSPRQFLDPDLVAIVKDALERSGLDASRLCLEITETTVMDDVEAASATLTQLKQLGIVVAIDDFGTGWSSLAQLKHLPIDVLKVDKSLIDDVGDRHEDRAIAGTVLALADALGLTAIAEGVESEHQVMALRAVGYRAAQGFHFARPLAPGSLSEFLCEPSPAQSRATRQ